MRKRVVKVVGKKKAIFVDRDGTIVHEVNYCNSPDKLKLIKNAASAIRMINESPFLAVLVTNQSGVARGYFPESTVHEVNSKLLSMLEEKGAYIDGVYYCPHYPEAKIQKYKKLCKCRKPGTGMLEQAKADLSISMPGSFIVGDKYIDVETGHNAGISGVLVMTGHGEAQRKSDYSKWKRKPDIIVNDLHDAVSWILSTSTLKSA